MYNLRRLPRALRFCSCPSLYDCPSGEGLLLCPLLIWLLSLKHTCDDCVRYSFQQLDEFTYSFRHERSAKINAFGFQTSESDDITTDNSSITRTGREPSARGRQSSGNGAAWYLDLNEPLAAGAGQTWAGDLIYDVVASQ